MFYYRPEIPISNCNVLIMTFNAAKLIIDLTYCIMGQQIRPAPITNCQSLYT